MTKVAVKGARHQRRARCDALSAAGPNEGAIAHRLGWGRGAPWRGCPVSAADSLVVMGILWCGVCVVVVGLSVRGCFRPPCGPVHRRETGVFSGAPRACQALAGGGEGARWGRRGRRRANERRASACAVRAATQFLCWEKGSRMGSKRGGVPGVLGERRERQRTKASAAVPARPKGGPGPTPHAGSCAQATVPGVGPGSS